MATYTNLASLAGLQVGDVVNYTTDTAIDFANINVQVELNGLSASKGGYTKFNFDSSKVTSSTNYYFSKSGGCSLCYGSSYDAYKRIGVAGDKGSSSAKGGGLTGASGSSDGVYFNASAGGSQTSGGSGATIRKGSGAKGSDGTFGVGGAGGKYESWTTTYKGGNGGDGWYGGGGGGASSQSDTSSGAGGSGFVIGQSTSVYPSGYMAGDATLISQLESAVSNGVLTQGGSVTSQTMTITVVSLPGPSTHESVKVYDSTQQSFIPCEVYYYNNGNFQVCEVYQYNNGQFIKINI